MSPLSFADWGDEIDDASNEVVGIVRDLHDETIGGMHRREAVEVRSLGGLVGVSAVDGLDREQGWVLLVAVCRSRRAGNHVTLAEVVLANEFHRHVGVVAARQIAVHSQEAVALTAEIEVPLHRDRFAIPLFVAVAAFVAVSPPPTAAAVAGVGSIGVTTLGRPGASAAVGGSGVVVLRCLR